MTTLSEIDKDDERYVQVLDKGFVGLVDWMGSDDAVVQAARVSYGTGTKKVQEDRGLIRYLMRHEHTTPFEMCEVKFHIRLPIFVMRQLIRHRTAQVNEYSGRYSVMTDEFYIPETFQKQSTANRQGREDSLDKIQGQLSWTMDSVHKTAYSKYEELLDLDVARETARAVLPVSNYTEAYWKCNIKNFLHMAWLRMDAHAQWEIQEFARAMYGLVKPLYPSICEAYEDYKLYAVRSSRMEVEFLKEALSSFMNDWNYHITAWFEQEDIKEAEKLLCKKFGLTNRELIEFKEKWV